MKNIPRLKNLARDYKLKTLEYVQSVYVKFEALPKRNDGLLIKARNLEKDLSKLNTSIEKFLMKDLQEAATNEFVENNIKKRQRANIQLKQLNVVNRLRDLEITKMSDQLKKIKIATKKLEENIKSHGIYPKFLQDLVREYPKKFVEPIDVIFSYRELMQVNDEAMERFSFKATSLRSLRTAKCACASWKPNARH